MKYQVTASITEVFETDSKDEAIELMADYIRVDTKPGDFNYEVEEHSEGGEQ